MCIRDRGDYERLVIPIAFEIEGSSSAVLLAQRPLLKALNRPRNVLTWNPDPDTCSDVYFATYASTLDTNLEYLNQGFVFASIELLADPFPYPAETTIFDSTAILARMDGAVSYTHLRAHETVLDLVCRLL